ncbi:hypothetical protein [Bdellovibrio bacteriovorus]|uniref:hypothetical protein n=1 Tax=Bdellovibrio bacteriovorus TaxID=959 RepID=UPI0035A68D7D
MKNTKQIFTTILTMTAVAFLTACGSSNQMASTDLSSRVPSTSGSTSKPLAYCNQANGEVSAKLKVYTESSNSVRMDLVYVRLTALPTSFKNDNSYITMWKWLANSSGSTYLDNTALRFFLIDVSTGKALTDWKTTLRWSDVVTTASALGITDVQTFFNRVNILVDLKDANGEYDVLKIANYDVSTNKAITQTDALLPMFYANPADYAVESNGFARAQALQGLHPFASYTNQGFSSAQFQSMANNFCF